MNDLKRYENALEEINKLNLGNYDAQMIAREALHPAPQYEDVEVVLWAKVSKKTGIPMLTSTSNDILVTADSDYTVVRITGTFPREIKPKVMRWQELPRNNFSSDYQVIHPTAKFYAEWEE